MVGRATPIVSFGGLPGGQGPAGADGAGMLTDTDLTNGKTNAVDRPAVEQTAETFSVANWGMTKAKTFMVTASITAAAATLTSTGTFADAAAGNQICVLKAGETYTDTGDGLGAFPLLTTISSKTNSNEVVLADNAGTTISAALTAITFGVDNAAVLTGASSLMADLDAYVPPPGAFTEGFRQSLSANARVVGGDVFIPPGAYFVKDAAFTEQVTVRGVGRASRLLPCKGATYVLRFDRPSTNQKRNFSNRNAGVYLYDFMIDGMGRANCNPGGTTSLRAGLEFDRCDQIVAWGIVVEEVRGIGINCDRSIREGEFYSCKIRQSGDSTRGMPSFSLVARGRGAGTDATEGHNNIKQFGCQVVRSEGTAIHIDTHVDVYNAGEGNSRNFVLDGGFYHGPDGATFYGDVTYGASAYTVWVGHADNVHIKACRILTRATAANCSEAIMLSGAVSSNKVNIEDCTFNVIGTSSTVKYQQADFAFIGFQRELVSVTATGTSGTATVTVSSAAWIRPWQSIYIAGEANPFFVEGLSGTTVTLDRNLSTSPSGAAVTFGSPVYRLGVSNAQVSSSKPLIRPSGAASTTAIFVDAQSASGAGGEFGFMIFAESDWNTVRVNGERQYAGTPNGAITPDFEGQRCYDRTNLNTYVARSVGQGFLGNGCWRPESVKLSAAPTSDGTWVPGDVVWDSTPVSAAAMGWVCSVGGSSGTVSPARTGTGTSGTRALKLSGSATQFSGNEGRYVTCHGNSYRIMRASDASMTCTVSTTLGSAVVTITDLDPEDLAPGMAITVAGETFGGVADGFISSIRGNQITLTATADTGVTGATLTRGHQLLVDPVLATSPSAQSISYTNTPTFVTMASFA